MMTAEPRLPLEDIRVIDLADEKGVFGAKLLADLGADVIRVEKPGGDAIRNIGPFKDDDPHPEKSLYFAYNNTNKRSITLDITHPDGADILRHLAENADVIIETFRPGCLKELGLDYESLGRENPRLIMTSVTGFGQYGPYSQFNAPDIVSFAMGGLMFQTGDTDMPPLLAGGMQTYYICSLFAAAATMVAIQAREKLGKGQHVDVSMQECIAAILEVMSFYVYDKHATPRMGARHHGACPSDNYPCKDGYWSICVGPHSQIWVRLLTWLINDGVDVGDLSSPEYEIGDRRRAVIDTRINPILREWAMSYTKTAIFKYAQENDVPITPVNTVADVLADEHLKIRNYFLEVEHPVIGKAAYPGTPWQFPGREHIVRPAPLIGEHNREVFAALGITEEEMVTLKGAGVI